MDPAVENVDVSLDCTDDSGAVRSHSFHVVVDDGAKSLPPAPLERGGMRVADAVRGDPRTLSQQELMALGYPPRPDEKKSPDQFAHWLEMLSRRPTVLVPHQVYEPKEMHGSTAGSPNWAGWVITLNCAGTCIGPTAQDHYKGITGLWNVPQALAEGGAFELTYSSEWVGLDGASWNGFSSTDVVQLGTNQYTQTIFGFQASTYGAWTEWYPRGEDAISNFPVSPNDSIWAWVGVGNPDGSPNPAGNYGWCYMYNETQNVASGWIAEVAPAGVKYGGLEAEWIMERPTINGSLPQLAEFAPTYMTGEAVDYNGNEHTYLMDTPVQVTMFNGSDELAYAYSLPPKTVGFEWVAHQ